MADVDPNISIDEQIKNFQRNMTVLRSLAGWSVKDFAELTGMTPQAIRNLERNNGKPKMSRVQYIAFRSILEAEIKNKNDDALENVLHVLVDKKDESVPETTKQQIAMTATAVANGASKAVAATALTGLLASTVGIVSGAMLSSIPKILGKMVKSI